MEDLLGVRLETARLRLRPVEASDRDAIFSAFTPAVTRLMGVAAPTHPTETGSWIAETRGRMERGEELVCAILLEGEPIGCAGLHCLGTPEPELGIWLAEARQGRGYGLEAVAALHAWGSRRYAPRHFRYPVDEANRPSIRIARRLGGAPGETRESTTADGRSLRLVEYRIPAAGDFEP